MGCGASTPTTASAKYDKKSPKSSEELQGKHRYVGDMGSVVCTFDEKKTGTGLFLVFVSDLGKTVFVATTSTNDRVFVCELSDEDFTALRDAQNITMTFSAIFKSIATEVAKSKVKISLLDTSCNATFSISSIKDAKTVAPLTVALGLLNVPIHQARATYVVAPLTLMVQHKRLNTEEKEKELKVSRLQMQGTIWQASIVSSRESTERVKKVILPLREQAAQQSKATTEVVTKTEQIERRIKRLQHKNPSSKKLLDMIYEDGGAHYYQHLPDAEEHIPAMRSVDDDAVLARWIQASLPSCEGEALARLSRLPGDPDLARLIAASPNGNMAEQAMRVLERLDQWDMSVFDLEKATGNQALFFTTYAILYKLNLVSHFNIDDRILRNFLSALQAGYHPNPYHNATHAADVAQVNYFIMTTGGIVSKLQLGKEELLAGVLAGAIHDYDHPGFNNNFHTRTNAYLSTLYNDRSILENHHCACIFEMLRRPEYDIFKGLPDDSKHEIRDTMLEMVLATDMGNHAKIFSAFRRRMAEGPVWHEKKDDIYLALSMSIKMADVSNCGRPQRLYLEWAKNIATEFYAQGDAEDRRSLSISPFMDRRKDKTDFPKGQISFMNYVVVPMFEAIAEFLPPVEVALHCCTENKEYWQNQE